MNIQIFGTKQCNDTKKGYYIVNAINDAINAGKKISSLYFDYSGSKRQVLKNDGKPYTLSLYDLIWDGHGEPYRDSKEILGFKR